MKTLILFLLFLSITFIAHSQEKWWAESFQDNSKIQILMKYIASGQGLDLLVQQDKEENQYIGFGHIIKYSDFSDFIDRNDLIANELSEIGFSNPNKLFLGEISISPILALKLLWEDTKFTIYYNSVIRILSIAYTLSL